MKIGLTGNICSGKTTVEKILRQFGAPVINADETVHELYTHEAIKQLLVQIFTPEDIQDNNGKINRKKLGSLVFNNPKKLKQLTDIIHPKVRQQIDTFLREHSSAPAVFASIPLLFESSYYTQQDYFDQIWFIYVDPTIQLERVIERERISKHDALARIKLQMSQDDKMQKADVVIDNSGSLEILQSTVEEYYKKLITFSQNRSLPYF